MPLTLEDVYRLHGVKDMKGIPELQDFLIKSTERLLKEHGEAWIIKHRGFLRAEWEYICELQGVTKPEPSQGQKEDQTNKQEGYTNRQREWALKHLKLIQDSPEWVHMLSLLSAGAGFIISVISTIASIIATVGYLFKGHSDFWMYLGIAALSFLGVTVFRTAYVATVFINEGGLRKSESNY